MGLTSKSQRNSEKAQSFSPYHTRYAWALQLKTGQKKSAAPAEAGAADFEKRREEGRKKRDYAEKTGRSGVLPFSCIQHTPGLLPDYKCFRNKIRQNRKESPKTAKKIQNPKNRQFPNRPIQKKTEQNPVKNPKYFPGKTKEYLIKSELYWINCLFFIKSGNFPPEIPGE